MSCHQTEAEMIAALTASIARQQGIEPYAAVARDYDALATERDELLECLKVMAARAERAEAELEELRRETSRAA